MYSCKASCRVPKMELNYHFKYWVICNKLFRWAIRKIQFICRHMLLEYHITFVLRYLVVIIKWEIEAKDSVFVLTLHNITLEFFVNWQMFTSNTVVDPGFPSRVINSKGGSPTYYVAKFLLKTAWNWKKFDRGLASLAPSNATDITGLSQILFNFILSPKLKISFSNSKL